MDLNLVKRHDHECHFLSGQTIWSHQDMIGLHGVSQPLTQGERLSGIPHGLWGQSDWCSVLV